jgi:hypothetical protein
MFSLIFNKNELHFFLKSANFHTQSKQIFNIHYFYQKLQVFIFYLIVVCRPFIFYKLPNKFITCCLFVSLIASLMSTVIQVRGWRHHNITPLHTL